LKERILSENYNTTHIIENTDLSEHKNAPQPKKRRSTDTNPLSEKVVFVPPPTTPSSDVRLNKSDKTSSHSPTVETPNNIPENRKNKQLIDDQKHQKGKI